MEERHEIIHFSEQVPGKIFLHKLGSVPKHWHRSIEVLFVLAGTVSVVIDDRTYLLKSTDIVAINSLSTHELYSDGAELLAFQINLSKSHFFEEYKDCYFDCCSCDDTDNPRFDLLRHLLARLIKENSVGENKLISHSIIALLLNELVTTFQIPQPENTDAKKKALQQLTKITDYIQKHFNEGLSLAELAEEFHFSQSYLSRFFKENIGVTYSSYYNAIRLDHAVNEMLSSDEAIAVIAANNGFPNARAMVSLFKKKYGMLPSEYRAGHPSYIPKEVVKNEVNYLAVSTSESLSSLAKYLQNPNSPEGADSSASRNRPTETIQAGSVDTRKARTKLRHTWRQVCCVGSTRDLLYDEVRQMLKKLQTDMPFQYVKFHGLLSDDMMLYDELSNGQVSLSFTLLDKVFDFLLSINLKPWMQLAFMPSALASDPEKTSFFTKQNSSPPKNLERWNCMIDSLVRHCIERYSLEEVLSWPFSLWNEPDTTPAMFGFYDKEDFFRLYEATYKTVKSIHPDFFFGSPSLLFLPEDQLNWYHPFFAYCRDHGCLPDFVNLHYYNDDIELVGGLQNCGRLLNKLNPEQDAFSTYLDHIYSHLEEYHLEGKPFYMTEWNLTVSHRNLINDTCFKGCYLTKNLLENYDRLESFGYWSLTDLIGELQLPKHQFHGGLGMFTMNQIPKAHYHIFRMIAELGDVLLSSGKGWFVTKQSKTGNIRMIFYNYSHYDKLISSGETFDMTLTNRYNSFSGLQHRTVSVTLTHLPFDRCRVREIFVNRDCGSSYDAWLRMGGLELSDQRDLDYLCQVSQPGRTLRMEETASGTFTYLQALAPLEVRLVEIDGQPS